jgi:sister chromatid cohesion protein PDS5
MFLEKKFLNSKDSEVKIRTANIFAEVLRIYAPETPYSDPNLKKIFKLFINEFQNLEDVENSLYSLYFQLLEKLSVIKIFVLLTTPELSADNLINETFTNLFNVVK